MLYEVITKRGTEGYFFYLVLNGEVELIERRDDNSTCMIGRIGEGGHFGESSLLTGQKRSVSIRAVSDVVLGRFSGAFFQENLLADPVFHKELDKALVNRLRFAMRDHVETIVITSYSIHYTKLYEIKVIFMSGYTSDMITSQGVLQPGESYNFV